MGHLNGQPPPWLTGESTRGTQAGSSRSSMTEFPACATLKKQGLAAYRRGDWTPLRELYGTEPPKQPNSYASLGSCSRSGQRTDTQPRKHELPSEGTCSLKPAETGKPKRMGCVRRTHVSRETGGVERACGSASGRTGGVRVLPEPRMFSASK